MEQYICKADDIFRQFAQIGIQNPRTLRQEILTAFQSKTGLQSYQARKRCKYEIV